MSKDTNSEPTCARGHLARFHKDGRCEPAKGWCDAGCDGKCSATEATDGAPYHVDGRTVYMTTRSGKVVPVAHGDVLTSEYIRQALAEKWERENGLK